MTFEELFERSEIFDRQIEDIGRGKPGGIGREDSEDAPGKAGLKIGQGVIPGYPGDPGHQKRERRIAERRNVIPLGLVCITV